MPIWTSHPELLLAAALGAALLFSASLLHSATMLGTAPSIMSDTRLAVLEDTVVVSAPAGYCIDNLATLSGERAAFVLMASCAAVTGSPNARQPKSGGLLTASIDGRVADFPSHKELRRYLASPRGHASLSRTGEPGKMTLDGMYSRRGVLFVHANERISDGAMGRQSWRAIFALDGRMVTATLRELTGHPISREEGFRTVEQLVEGIVAVPPHDRDLSFAR